MWSEEPPFRPPPPSRLPWILAVVVALLLGWWAGRAGLFERMFERRGSAAGGQAEVRREVERRAGPEQSAGVESGPRPMGRPAPARHGDDDGGRQAELPPSPPTPAWREIYLCKDYSGRMFWSRAHCHKHRAMIDRIARMPGHYSWEAAVAAAEQQRSAAQSLYEPPRHESTAAAGMGTGSSAGPSGECEWLAREVERLDATARQPQPAAVQDALRAQRQAVRSRQAALRC